MCFTPIQSGLESCALTSVFPGPRIVTVRAKKSFTHTVTTEREGTDTHVVIRKIKFKIAFSCEMKALGMLRACREARQVIVERLPLRLRSRDSDQEIRLGVHDVLSVRNIKRFLADPLRAESYELEIPTAIFQIPALVFFSDIDGATDLQGFWSLFFGGYDSSPLHISVLKALRTLVFCPEDRRQSTHGDADCFSDYTTNFDSSLLTPDQSGPFAHAKTSESILKHDMNIAKQASCTWPTDMKIPEIKIMAKG